SKPDSVDIKVADFDGAIYHISNPGQDRFVIWVSISLKFFKELEDHGAHDLLKARYGNYLLDTTEPGYNTTTKNSLCRRLCLSATVLPAFFEKYFNLQAAGGDAEQRAVIHYRDDETLYVEALPDRVTVIFSVVFRDPDDIIVGKVFLQEFVESRRDFNQAPQVLYSHKNPPSSIAGTDALVADNVAYVTFVLFPRHTSPEARDKTIDLVHMFRNYLHYHIKCSKVYIHMRMRAKTNEFLSILNRARPSYANEQKEKKTMSGRTFRRD
uniref:Arp2/3 complex 34 kDa subunit n=1 Tax=Macrostomum lignano TaxID=282301 RepID=A0A1I8JC12_9PLAT